MVQMIGFMKWFHASKASFNRELKNNYNHGSGGADVEGKGSRQSSKGGMRGDGRGFVAVVHILIGCDMFLAMKVARNCLLSII